MKGEDIEKLIEKLLVLIDASEENQQQLKKLLEETLAYNLATALIEGFTEEQKTSFRAYVQEHGVSDKTVADWAQQNLSGGNADFTKRADVIILKTIEDFFKAVTQDISDQKRQEMLAVINAQRP